MLKHVIVTVILICVSHLIRICECTENNVCKSLEDYRTIQVNPNCWYDPDVDASPKEIVERYGFPFESYEITTKDGYINSLFRVPHNGSEVNQRRPVVFLQHGIAVDGATWLAMGLNSTAFVFANNGYDVWISNCRGTRYSSKHVKYNIYDRDYWIFSFHELALYDVAAMIDFIAEKTGQAGNITYIGHSMGSTISYVYASLMPDESRKKLKRIVSLAPVAYMDHVSATTRSIAPFRYLIWDLFASLGLYGIGPNIQFKLDVFQRLCIRYPFIIICSMLSNLVSGNNDAETMPKYLPISLRHYPSGLSLKTLFHYAQIMATKKRFQFFDYGPELNLHLYNSSYPPEYPLSQIKVPVDLFYGKNDLLAREKDVYHLYGKLNTEKTIKEVFGFAHLDFMFGKHASDFYRMLASYL